jgi:acetyltransferase-like isoleucine patch superfamily enzyme
VLISIGDDWVNNIFFDISKLKRCGENVIIGKTVRIRYPELVELGDNVIIDDFTYISTSLVIDSYVHIASGCKLIGGGDASIVFGSFSTLAPNVVLAAGSDDYKAGIATPLVGKEYKGSIDVGMIEIGRHSIVGANSVVLPNVMFGEGAALGALSLAKQNLSPWSLNAGVPSKKIKTRNKEEILKLEQQFIERLKNV